MLMEVINPGKLDFLTLAGDIRGMESLSDDKIKEINDNLLVRSFEELLEKFAPTVYSYYRANNQRVVYQLDKLENVPEEMLTDMISPKKVMDAIRQNRKELQYTYGEYAKLDEEDPKKKDMADKLNVMFEEASANYNNVMALLPLAIEDIKTRLLLGIRCYFEQYPKKIKGMRPSMLVINQSNEMLAKSSNISKMITYLNTVNAKNDFSNTVWYAVLPNVSLDQYSKMKLTRERFKGNSKTEKSDVNSVESLTRILDVFKDYGVQRFFSYEADDSTTFNALATEGIEKYENRCASMMGKPFSEFAIPCLPNFTVIPKDKSGVVLDSRMVISNDAVELSGEKEDIMKLWIDGVYVGAAYVAVRAVTRRWDWPNGPRFRLKRQTATGAPRLPW